MNLHGNVIKPFSVKLTLRDRKEYAPIRQFELNNENVKMLSDNDMGMFITERDFDKMISWVKFWDTKIIQGYQIIVINSVAAFNEIVEGALRRNGTVKVLRPREYSFAEKTLKKSSWGEHTLFTHPLALKNLKPLMERYDMKIVHYCLIDPKVKMHTFKGKYCRNYYVDDNFSKHTLELLNRFGTGDMKASFSMISKFRPIEVWTDNVRKSYGLNAFRFFNLQNVRLEEN